MIKLPRLDKHLFSALTAIVLILLMTSCSIYKPILSSGVEHPLNQTQIAALIQPNKVYKVMLKERREVMITVRSIDQENIFGVVRLLNVGRDINRNILINRHGSIRLDNIEAIQQRKISPVRTALLVSVSALGGYFIFTTWVETFWTSPAIGI